MFFSHIDTHWEGFKGMKARSATGPGKLGPLYTVHGGSWISEAGGCVNRVFEVLWASRTLLESFLLPDSSLLVNVPSLLLLSCSISLRHVPFLSSSFGNLRVDREQGWPSQQNGCAREEFYFLCICTTLIILNAWLHCYFIPVTNSYIAWFCCVCNTI